MLSGPAAPAWLTALLVLALTGAGRVAAEPAHGAPPPRQLVEAVTTAQAEAASMVADWCDRLDERLFSVHATHCRGLSLAPTGAASPLGTPILLRDAPPVTPGPDNAATLPPRVLMIGGIHGDELTSVSIMFSWLDWLDDGAGAGVHWRVAPLVNPDGLLIKPSTRYNSNGVDLNRNFPTPDWSRDALAWWDHRTGNDPRRYPGPQAASEPETRWMIDEIERFDPHLIVAVHAPYGILDFDGPATEPRRFGRLHLNRLGVYPGSLGNYGGVYKAIPVVTIELPSATRMPTPAQQRAIWDDMLAWIERHIVPGLKARAPTEAVSAAEQPAPPSSSAADPPPELQRTD